MTTTDYLKALDEQREELIDNLNVITPGLNLSDTAKFNKINDEMFAHYPMTHILNAVPGSQYSACSTNGVAKTYISIEKNGEQYTVKFDLSKLTGSKTHFVGGQKYRFINTNNSNVENRDIIPDENTQILEITNISIEPRYFVLLILSSGATKCYNAFLDDNTKSYVTFISCFNTSDSSSNINAVLSYFGAVQTSIEPYYQLMDDGTLTLSPIYSGAGYDEFPYSVSDNGARNNGSKNHELLETLILPPTFQYSVVSNLADGMFIGNNKVKKIALPNQAFTVLPDAATIIPQYFCYEAQSLEKVYNTKNVTEVGTFAFYDTNITDIDLTSATKIGKTAFGSSRKLKKLNGGSAIEEIGTTSFMYTPELKDITDILDSIKERNIVGALKDGAMYLSSIRYNWNNLDSSNIEGNATPLQWNSNTYQYWVDKQDYAKTTPFTRIENPTPTKFYQYDFGDLYIGANLGDNGEKGNYKSKKPYSDGCAFLVLAHAYCGLRGYKLTSPIDMEEKMWEDAKKEGKENDLGTAIKNYYGNIDGVKPIADALGLSTEVVDPENYKSDYADLVDKFYDELQVPGTYFYISLTQGTPITGDSTHAECCIGVAENGNIIMLDSNDRTLTPFEIPPQNIYLDIRRFMIIREGTSQTNS